MREDPPRRRGHFRAGDVVWTPLKRKAILKRWREDGKWDACYQSELGGTTNDKVTLQPEHITPADDE